MKKSKAKFWMALWLIVMVFCAIVLGIERVAYIFQNGTGLEYPPFTVLQNIALFGVLPFVLLPLLIKAFRHAVQEKIKWIKILSGVLIVHHTICAIGFLLAAMGLI